MFVSEKNKIEFDGDAKVKLSQDVRQIVAAKYSEKRSYESGSGQKHRKCAAGAPANFSFVNGRCHF